MRIKAIKKSTASEQVYEALHRMIASNDFRPGDKLPSQDILAQQFGVSRLTVREAVHKLEALGKVRVIHGVGTVVDEFSADRYLELIGAQVQLSPAEISELMEARLFLETDTAQLAAMKAEEDDVRRLRDILKAQMDASEAGDAEAFTDLDFEFHKTLAEIGRNSILLRFLSTMRQMLHRFISQVVLLEGMVRASLRFHTAIVDAIERGDHRGAKQKMAEHLLNVAQRIESEAKTKLNLEPMFKIHLSIFRDTKKDACPE